MSEKFDVKMTAKSESRTLTILNYPDQSYTEMVMLEGVLIHALWKAGLFSAAVRNFDGENVSDIKKGAASMGVSPSEFDHMLEMVKADANPA